MSEWDWWRRFKEANATERAYVIVLAVFFALFVVGAFFFDHAVVAVLVPVLWSSQSCWSSGCGHGRIDMLLAFSRRSDDTRQHAHAWRALWACNSLIRLFLLSA